MVKKSTKTSVVKHSVNKEPVAEPKMAEPVVEAVKPKEDNEVTEGRNVFAMMTPEEVNELLERIDAQCTPLDKVTGKKREKMMDWDKVSFSSYGPGHCQAVWVFLRQHTRNFRILSEIVNEVKVKFSTNNSFQTKLIESMPGYPQKPPTALGGFHYFNREAWEKQKATQIQSKKDLPNFIKFQRECREKYDTFSNQEKSKYEELSALELAAYKRQVKEFYAENPGLAQYVAKLKEETTNLKNKKKSESRKSRQSTTKEKESKTKNPPQSKKDKNLPDPYADAPEFPLSSTVLFIQSKLNRLVPPPTSEELSKLKNKYFDKWKGLSDSKKSKWINQCVHNCHMYLEELKEYQKIHPEYTNPKMINIKQLISKEELSIWETVNERPNNPKQSVFDLFYEEFLLSEEDADLPESERKKIALSKWNKMDWYHKEMYGMKYKISIVEYKKQLQTYFSKIPEFLKPVCQKRIHKKFWKLLEELDKVPGGSSAVHESNLDPITGLHEGGNDEDEYKMESLDEEPSKKKRKKDKKKKKEETSMIDVEEYANYDEEYHENDEFQQKIEHEEMEEEAALGSVKKQKKKKTHKRKNEDETFITGDIFSDSQSESYGEIGENPLRRCFTSDEEGSGPIFSMQLTEKQKRHLRKLKRPEFDERIQKSVTVEVEKMKAAVDKPVVVYHEKNSPSNKKFTRSTSILQKDIFDAIRGIFDGRPFLGRQYSAFYYYAKFVANEKFWIDCMNKEGLRAAALKIIKTFLSLKQDPKERFLQKSYRYHREKRHGFGKSTFAAFPGEPKPPPKKARELYHSDMQKRKQKTRNFVQISWKDLPDNLHMYYIKKLYHETRLYLKRFDMFMSSMTPNDMVEYTLYRAKKWEEQLYTKQTLQEAVKQFVFPLPKQEVEEIGRESDLEITNEVINTKTKLMTKRERQRMNPFANCEKIISKLTGKNVSRKELDKNKESESNDEPSEDELMDLSLYLSSSTRKINAFKRRRKIRETEKYFYPIDDMKNEVSGL